MNTKNDQCHQDTIAAIEAAFVSLLNKKELKDISVSELCEEAEISRSTFYEKYMDDMWQIPMTGEFSRSLNLANAVSIVLYEAMRQNRLELNI